MTKITITKLRPKLLFITHTFKNLNKVASTLPVFLLVMMAPFLGFGQQKSTLTHKEQSTTFTFQKSKTNFDKAAFIDSIKNIKPSKKRISNNNVIDGALEQPNQSPFDVIKGKKEEVSKRNYTSKHFVNEDGSLTALIGAGPIHYKKDNNFYEIDHSIIGTSNSNYPQANKTNLFESHFGATANLGVKNITKEGELSEFLNAQMYWEVNGQKQAVQNAANTPISVEGDKAYYHNIYGTISAEFTVLSGKRKLNYIIPDQSAFGSIPLNADYLVFSEEIQLPNGWTHTFDEKKGVIIKNSVGNPIYAYKNPQVFENYNSDFLIPEKTNVASFEILKTGNTLTILVKVKINWLKDPNRIYPLAVDPTVNVIPDDAVFWSGWVDAAGFGGNDFMYIGFDGGVENNAFVKFNLSTIPVGSDVTAVTSSLYRFGGVGTTNNNRRMIIGGCNEDPVTAPTWLDIYNGYTGNISNDVPANNNVVGYKTNTFDAGGLTYIENALIDGETSILAWPSGTFWQAANYASFYGYSRPNNQKPYLTITYIDPCNPISASASQPVICEGESTTLNVTGTAGYTYQWFDDFDADTLTGNLIGSGNAISVSPTESAQFVVLSNCGTYDFVGVAVVPPPSVMVTSPIQVDMCDSNDIVREISVTGGNIPEIVLNETFNPDSSIPWYTTLDVIDGDPMINDFGFWSLGDDTVYPGWSSNDNSQFALIDNDYYGFLHYFVLGNTIDFEMTSNLVSPPFSLADYEAPINLNFFQYFRAEFGGVGNVQISTDLGINWTTIQTYTTTQGLNNNFSEVNLSLDDYAGEPVVMLRYNYVAEWDWYWAIDNVTITGTPRPTTLSWAPFTNLYLDDTATTPYNGENASTVYTLPENNITYTVTAESFYGCSIDIDVDVIGGVAIWDGTNWLNSSLPGIGKNVVLNGNYLTNATTGSFSACNLVVNANLRITDDYFVEVENNVTVNGDLVVESRGALVQNDDLGSFNLNGSGTSSVIKRTALKQNWYDYTYWSSPVVNETVADAFPNTPANRRFRFDAINYLDENGDDIDDAGNVWTIAPAGAILTPGVGYAATSVNIGPAFPRTDLHNFNGAFNTGDINVNVYTNPLNLTNNWNFIGNPYPSAISFYDFYDENIGTISGAAYLWSQASPPDEDNPGNEILNFNQNDYAIITAYSGGTAGASGVIPTEFIPSGQGFFVNALSTGTVTFKNNSRSTDIGSNSQFFRNSESQTNRIWIDLTSDNGVFSQILVAYLEGATNSFDGYAFDAPRNLATESSAALFTTISDLNDRPFAIQGKNLNSLTIDEIIHLGFNTAIGQPTIYSVSVAKLEGAFLNNQTIYLKDNLLNLFHDLSESPYNFVSEPGQFLERFEIHFQSPRLTLMDNELKPSDLTIIELNDGLVQFKVGNNHTIKSVQIFDLLGRSLYQLEGENASETYNLSNLSQAAYVAKVTLSSGQVIVKRSIKQK